ncbi:kynureninase, partial [Candidatus Bipolaricaulota bacterium]
MEDQSNTGLAHARQLDALDELAPYREHFHIEEPDLIYLDGNSLGRLPRLVDERMRQVVEQEWGGNLVSGWKRGWYEAPARVGDKIAQIVGAGPNQLIVGDSTSV